MTAQERLTALAIELPPASAPAGTYVGIRRSGSLAFVPGQIPSGVEGLVRTDFTVATAPELSREAVSHCLAQLRRERGSLDRERRIVKLTGYVRSAPGFGEQPEVVNGASDLLVDVFGDAGRDARAAIGVAELPRRVLVEIELVVEIGDLLAEIS